jgi:hypothetical protein
LLLGGNRCQGSFGLGNAIEHGLAVCLDAGLQRQLLAVCHGTAATPVKERNVDLRTDHGMESEVVR